MKKFLSLVLALIMTMSLVTISAGATEYRDLTDKDEIQYEEAVAVLNRIGVITGYDDGSFRPETELTRGAAAKIIVSLLIGPEAASNLPNQTAPYPDVPASHTFAGVISYCKTAKIISGYGDGTFKPGNSLTGFAFAKMLLGALGYNSEIEGFVDTGWSMNVARIGHETGLFDRLDFDGAGAVNRETACQLALNTLKATMVTYGGNTMVSGAQTLVVKGTQAMYVTSNNREINANINRRVINAANNEMTLEFGEAKFKDLRLEHDKYDPAYDDFGHPSNEWSYKKVTIGTFKLPADFTFDKQMAHLEDTVATKEKALDLRGYDTYSTDHRANYTNWSSAAGGTYAYNSPFADATQVTINGWNARVHNTSYTQSMAPSGTKNGNLYSYDAGSSKVTKTSAPTLSEIADLTDNGVTVEVYVCPVDADFITNVVVTRTQLMKVKRIGSDYVTLEDIEPDSRDPRKDGDLAKITGYNAFAVDYPVIDVKDSNYDAYNALKDLKAGDRVAVVPFTPDDGKTWEVGEAYVPETVSGAFTKVDTYANVNKREGSAVAITVGGTSYPINEWNLDMLDVTGNKIKATKKDVTLYLAKDGTVLWADEIGNSDAWMVVGDYYQATGTNGKVGWFVHGWTIGGAEVDLDLGTIRGDAEKYAPGELVHYYIAENGNGEYALEKPNYNGYNHYKDGSRADDTKKTSGEGIYEVSQYTIDNDSKGLAAKYAIKSRNGALALENYGTDGENPPRVYNTSSAPNASDPAVKRVDKTGKVDVAHDFSYSNLMYDGVKFIFVNFDGTNGEVETIDFKSGIQNVDYTDLIRYNDSWKNIGTNDGQKFVVSAAEAYVNNKGVVKAVVVKADSSEADLSKIAVITDTPGDKNLNKGAEGDRVNGLSYAKQYVTGPNFNMSEEKTGYFDKDYPIGTILVISEKDDIIVGKYFHSTYYNNGNPDAVFVKGITPLKNINGGNIENGFLIGQGTNTVYTLNEKYQLTETVTSDTLVPDGSKKVDILTNKYVSGYDTEVNGELKGLIRVDSTTKFIDLRAINNDTIDNLGDLLDYDPATVELRVLVDGAASTDLFRHAYVVIVEKAGDKAVVDTGNVTLDKAGTALPVNNIYGKVSVNRLTGNIDWSVSFKAPAWATNNTAADLTFAFDLKANGTTLATIGAPSAATSNSSAVTISKSGDVFSASGWFTVPKYALDNGVVNLNTDTFSGVIKNVSWKYANVEFQFEDGSDASALVANAATEKLGVGSANKSTYAPSVNTTGYSGVASYNLRNATTNTTLPSATANFVDAYAEGGKAVIVVISGLTADKPADKYSVTASTADTVLFYDAGTTEPTTAPTVADSEWKTSLPAVEKDHWIVVKSATSSKLTTLSARGDDFATVVSPSQIGATGIFKFQMPEDNVQVGGAATNALVVEKKFLKADNSVLNVKLADGSEYDPTDPAQVEELAKQLGTGFNAVDKPGTTTGEKVLTSTLGAIGTINVADDLPVATINTTEVVGSAAADNLDDLMSLVGITATTNAFEFVKVGTNGFVAGDQIDSTNPDGKSYDTNLVSGASKWYAQFNTTPVALDPDGKLAGATATVTAGLITGSDTKSYAAIGSTLTVTIKNGTTTTGTVAAGVKVIVDTAHTNCTATLPTAPIVAAGGSVTAGQEFPISITLDTAATAVGAQLKLKLADI